MQTHRPFDFSGTESGVPTSAEDSAAARSPGVLPRPGLQQAYCRSKPTALFWPPMTEMDSAVGADAAVRVISREPISTDRLLLVSALRLLPRSAVVVLDLHLRIVEAFGEALSKRDYDPDEILGRAVSEVFMPETVDLLKPRLDAALAGEGSSFEMRSNDGIRVYLVDVRPILEGGEVKGVLGFLTEITQRKEAEAQVAEERQLFEDVLDSIDQIVSVKDYNRDLLHINRSLEKDLGVDRDKVVGGPIDALLDPGVAEGLADDDREVLEKAVPIRVEREMPARDGSVKTYLTEKAPLRRPDGSTYGVVTIATDITNRIVAERQLAEATKRFETAFENAPNGMSLVGIDGRFLRANPAMCDLVGYPAEELLELKVADIAHEDDMDEQVLLVKRALAGEFDSYSLEKRFTRKSGETVWLVLAVSLVRDENGDPVYVIAQTTNISTNKRIEEDLRSEAGKDPLTELANRRQIERAIGSQIERALQTGEPASVLMVDLDDFKAVNDRYGHETGDDVLRFFAKELRGEVRATDLPARFGGDEFVVLMSGVGAAQAAKISQQLMDHFEKLVYRPEGLALRCRISVGNSQIETGSESLAEVLAAADRSMYEVKRSKKPAG